MSKILVIRGWNAVLNIHERAFSMTKDQASAVLDSLSGPNEMLWPKEQWPPMILDQGLRVGSSGGHSKIRYTVSDYVPGKRVEFTFHPMVHLGTFCGRHYFEVLPGDGQVIIRHTIDVRTNFRTWIIWKIFIERVHDAVVEDAFDKAERSTTGALHHSRWSLYVRFLRWWRARSAAKHSAK